MTRRKLDQPRGWAWTVAVGILQPTLIAVTRRTWMNGDEIPAAGGCVIALNHVSHIDPLVAGHFLYGHGRLARYLAKAGLYDNRALGFFMRAAGQIPVKRESHDANGAYAAAVQAVRAGECVVVYPEGTITRDPELWPMTGKTGAARIGLETGCPVIPVAHWGAQDILAPYGRKPHLFPRKKVTVKAGDPVELGDLVDLPTDAENARVATARIMEAITVLLEDIRGEKAPTERFDPRKSGVTLTGNPHKDKKKGKEIR
ncbi:MAG: 1-acyl-sn-glycerol-3-phosphate acyltransferase [Nocardioides sp.]|nr:1-acyl-sn-glycerol-3-phosphate acyltransferase [Nocardioides sp.]